MQKKIIALAVAAAAAGFASAPVLAQSSVTLYGSIDAGVRNLTNTNAAGQSITTMNSNGTYNSNRWGIKDSEDLGNGMQAHFVLESGFNNGTGAFDNATSTIFNRSAFVGLGGGWGNVDLGRQYTVIFKTTGNYDPFNYKYTGIIPIAGLDGARHNNEIQYQGSFNGLNVLASYALGETAGSSSAGSPVEIGLNYAAGPFSFGGAYMSMKDPIAKATAASATSPGTLATDTSLTTKNWTVGGAYAVAPFRVALGYDEKTIEQMGGPDAKVKNWWIGGSYNMSPAAALTIAYYDGKTTDLYSAVSPATTPATFGAHSGTNKLFVLGGTYALSKRTNLYADWDHRKLDGISVVGYPVTATTGTQDAQNGISIGVNHLF